MYRNKGAFSGGWSGLNRGIVAHGSVSCSPWAGTWSGAEGKLSEMRLERQTAPCSRELWVPEVLGLYSVGSL